MSLKNEIVNDLIEIENDLENQYFTYNNVQYNCTASITEIEKELDTGGFRIVRVLSLIVRLYDNQMCDVFAIKPQSQEIITYKSNRYRIVRTKQSTVDAYMRIMAEEIGREK